MTLISSQHQVIRITNLLYSYMRLPFSEKTIPGSILECIFAYIRNADVLNTYDFVDVIDAKNNLGWQIKSTKDTTPVTWKRAKIANSTKLIENSFKSDEAVQILGNAIIDFCNSHAYESIKKYNLKYIGYVRLIVFEDKIMYFEKELCSKSNPEIFDVNQYKWQWSSQKNTTKKEQLRALHGIDITTGQKAWTRRKSITF